MLYYIINSIMAFAVSDSFSNSVNEYDHSCDDQDDQDDQDNTQSNDLYCPDFSLSRRPVSHTVGRMNVYRNLYSDHEISIKRTFSDPNMVPITVIDELLNLNLQKICNTDSSIVLGKHGKFLTIREALEAFSTEMTQTYDDTTNSNILKYTVPISGFISSASRPITFGTDSAYFQKTSFAHKATNYDSPRERFIIIDGNKYSTFKTYKSHCGHFVPISILSNYYPTPIINDKEHVVRVAKTTCSKISITLTLPNDTMLSGLSLHPEPLQFDSVHSTTIKCHGKCTKSKHCIKCLKNEPGFIKSFKMFIRSSITNGIWILLGTFTGNTSYIDSTRISFDQIAVKEIRIVPTNCQKSFEKVEIFPIGPTITPDPVSDVLFVTYSLMMPRDGKYRKRFDKVREKFGGSYSICDCTMCTGRRSGKGTYKEKCRYLRDMYDM
jgi:hypothetical protein